MTLDAETLRWLLGGFFILSGAIISYLMNREISRVDKSIEAANDAIDELADAVEDSQKQLDNFKLNVAREYVSKIDLEKQLETHLSPIRDDMREVRGDVKALLQRP